MGTEALKAAVDAMLPDLGPRLWSEIPPGFDCVVVYYDTGLDRVDCVVFAGEDPATALIPKLYFMEDIEVRGRDGGVLANAIKRMKEHNART